MTQKISRKLSKQQLEELNAVRQSWGLSPIAEKMRACLSCNKKFISGGAWQRKCKNCADRDSQLFLWPGE
jgi:hypothetical protein